MAGGRADGISIRPGDCGVRKRRKRIAMSSARGNMRMTPIGTVTEELPLMRIRFLKNARRAGKGLRLILSSEGRRSAKGIRLDRLSSGRILTSRHASSRSYLRYSIRVCVELAVTNADRSTSTTRRRTGRGQRDLELDSISRSLIADCAESARSCEV